MRKVPFFNYRHVFKDHEGAIVDIVRKVGSRGAFIMQAELSDFETNLASYCGSNFAIGVGNATDAMEMFLSAGGVGPEHEVIICSHTMVATASAVKSTGAQPVPVDAGYDHLIDPDSIRRHLSPRTRAIMPTQLNGRTCNMDVVGEIAAENDLWIFEDSAQALGSRFDGQSAGTFGIAGCISFYPAKTLGCLGDGGAILCNDEELYHKLLLTRDHGRAADGNVVLWGRNSRLDNIQAAILDYLLNGYADVVDRRRTIAGMYQSRLARLEQVKVPPGPNADPLHFDVYQNYEIQVDRRDELKAHLANKGINTLIQWGGKAVHHHTELGFTQSLRNTDRLFERILMLPINMSIDDDDIHYVCDQIEAFYSNV